MFRSRIDLGGKTRVLKVGLLASPALLRCQRSLNSLVKCTTSRLPLNCLWTRQKSTCLNINEAAYYWQGSSSHTYLFVPMRTAAAAAFPGSRPEQKVLRGLPRKRNCRCAFGCGLGSSWADLRLAGTHWKSSIYTYIKDTDGDIMSYHHIKAVISNRGANGKHDGRLLLSQ